MARRLYSFLRRSIRSRQASPVFQAWRGKINAWRDYFDMNQFTSRMG